MEVELLMKYQILDNLYVNMQGKQNCSNAGDLSLYWLMETITSAFISSGSISEGLVVKQKENLAAHPLVLGPHYQLQDLRVSWAQHLHKDVSGKQQDHKGCNSRNYNGRAGLYIVRIYFENFNWSEM